MADLITPAAIGAGALLGGGTFLLVRETLPVTPSMGPALRRLHPGSATRLAEPVPRVWWRTLWRVPHRELALLGRTHQSYALSLVLSGLIGMALPTVASFMLASAGVPMPLVVPTAASLVLGGLAAWQAHRDVVSRAKRARYEFRRAVCSYLDLVTLELAAAHGPVAALERAASGIQGWVFERIRETLLRAQLQLRQPWEELRTLADTIHVPELGDLGDIVRVSGAEGAVVHETLRTRADSLRDQIRVEALSRAKTITSKLDIPGAMLLLVLAIFVLYPLLSRVG